MRSENPGLSPGFFFAPCKAGREGSEQKIAGTGDTVQSREAAKECSPRRKPWETYTLDAQAP
jgi:hypothetical protein